MPALTGTPGTGSAYAVAGKGTTTRKPSGKAKSYEGKGPAPSGTAKVAEKDYTEVPTVTVANDGTVSTSGFAKKSAAEAARAKQERSEARTKRIVAIVNSGPQKGLERPEGPKATEAPRLPSVPVSSYKRSAPGPKAKKTVAVSPHERQLPTPKEKHQARAKVKNLRQVVRKTTGVTGPLTQSQKQIAVQVAKETGLKPKTVATQELQEMSGGYAKQRDAEHNYNTLNIGYFDSGPGELTQGSEWSNPKTAARATSEFFKGQKYGPSSSIAAILPQAKGKPTPEQLNIIGNSGWAASDYATNLTNTESLVGEKRNPQAVTQLKVAEKEARSLGLKIGKPPGDVASAGPKMVKVRADAKGAVRWAESNIGHTEGDAKTMHWGANFGLNPVTQPWCANFISNDLARRGIKNLPSNPNYVPSYEEEWGQYAVPASQIKPGDLVTFSGEHIGLYVGGGEMVSGNSSDAVSRGSVGSPSMVIRPPYKGGWVKIKESTPLPGTLSSTGSLSESSAPASVGLVASPGGKGRAKKAKAKVSQGLNVAQVENKLQALSSPRSEAPSTSVLQELERKYAPA